MEVLQVLGWVLQRSLAEFSQLPCLDSNKQKPKCCHSRARRLTEDFNTLSQGHVSSCLEETVSSLMC